MPEITWDGPHPLQVDSWATNQARIYSTVSRDGRIWLEVTDGSDWWRAEFPAPWVKAVSAAVGSPPLSQERQDTEGGA